jgi:hypothetical protein
MFTFIRNTIVGNGIETDQVNHKHKEVNELYHDSSSSYSTDTENEENEENDDNVEEDNTALLEKYGKLLDTSIIDDDIAYSLYKIKMSDYTSFSESWNMNRGVDDIHVNKLYMDLKSMKYPHFIGSIKAVRTNNTIRTIDGQHRELAFKKLRNENITFDMDIILEVYTCEDITDIETIKIFENANKNKPITEQDMPELAYKKVIDKLREDPIFNKMIVEKDNGEVFAPRITYKNFYNKLQEHMKNKNYSVDQLVDAIKLKNKEFMDMKRWILMGGKAGKEIAKHKIASYEKAQKEHFFLNLPKGNHPMDVWMRDL